MKFTVCNLGPFMGTIAQPLSHYSKFRPVSLTMKQYLEFGRKGNARTSFIFLKTELLVRMANIMREFDLLPLNLLKTPSATMVGDWYRQSFEELLRFERADPSLENIRSFNDNLRTILKRHTKVVEAMAEAMVELKETDGTDISSEQNIQYFLDRFYLNRISIRMLQNQHLSIFDEGSTATENGNGVKCVGFIDPECDIKEVIIDAYDNARYLSENHFCMAPILNIDCINSNQPDHPIRIPLVPLHLYYIVFETLKNSIRATIEHSTKEATLELPPINISIVLGKENLSIKISDHGGGVSSARLDNLFHYMYSSAPRPEKNPERTPFAGYGYGLPISRLYARYFLGDLTLTSMEGLGTDALIYLKALPSEASELLPVFGPSSRRFITMTARVPDWITGQKKSYRGSIEPAIEIENRQGYEERTSRSISLLKLGMLKDEFYTSQAPTSSSQAFT